MMAAGFEEVLWIDADAGYFFRSPETLFSLPEYQENGTLYFQASPPPIVLLPPPVRPSVCLRGHLNICLSYHMCVCAPGLLRPPSSACLEACFACLAQSAAGLRLRTQVYTEMNRMHPVLFERNN
jgi:Mannosyltransferase putative